MSTTPEPQPVLECGAIVLRVLRNSGWMKDPSLAFLLRPDEIDTGLSVTWNMSIEDARNGFKKCYGALSLHVGRVRNLNLDVVPDEPQHANVKGLPHDNTKEAERFASLLAQQAREACELKLYKREE
jgi:hypothetical protein